MKRAELDGLDREALIRLAESHGISRPRILTRPELVDELLLRTADGESGAEVSIARGFFGLARDLVARVVERGLHLPDAATKIRGIHLEAPRGRSTPPAALPTVTLAQIYAAQGHTARAKETLLRVLASEPEHTEARELLERLSHPSYVPPAPPLPPEEEAARERAEAAKKATAPAEAPAPAEPEVAEKDNDIDGLVASEPSPGKTAGEVSTGDAPPPPEGTPDAPASAGEAREGEPFRAEETPEAARPEAAPEPEPAPSIAPVAAEAEAPLPTAVAEPAEVPAMLDDAPLPPKYDVDECVSIPVDPETLFVYWEVREELLAKVAEARGEGVLALRALVVEPGWHGPRTWSRDHDVFSPVGDYFLRELPKGAVVRVAVGYRTPSAFVPLAHAPLLALPRREPVERLATSLVRWTPEGVVPVGEGDVSPGGAMQRALRRVAEKGGGDEALAALLGLPELARFEGTSARGSS